MTEALYASKLPEVRDIGLVAFPSYSGKRFKVQTLEGSIRLDSYWSGGSIDYWSFVDLATMKTRSVQENGTPFSNGRQIEQLTELPFNVALVRHSIFCGKDMGLTVYVRPDQMSQIALPAPVELTREEKIVLCFTASLKSSYAGIKNYRFHEAHEDTGITLEAWESSKGALITRGLLNKAGAITEDGRNAINGVNRYDLK